MSNLGSVPTGSNSASGRPGSMPPSQPLSSHPPPMPTSPPPPPGAHPLSAGGVAPPASQAMWSARLMDLLNLVRHEFEVIGNDAVHFKSQRDELENRSTY